MRRFRLGLLPILVVALLMQIAAPVFASLAMSTAPSDPLLPGVVLCLHDAGESGAPDHGQPATDLGCCTYCVVATAGLAPADPPLPTSVAIVFTPASSWAFAAQSPPPLPENRPQAARAPPSLS